VSNFFSGRQNERFFNFAEMGASARVANQFNNTCLMLAAFKGYPSVVRRLIEAGANVNDEGTRCAWLERP